MNAATQLEGLVLPGGWTVGKLNQRSPIAPGGNFSQTYPVTNVDGRSAFLKALDYFSFFGQGEQTIELAARLFNFEKSMLLLCGQKNLDRVVRALADGEILIDPNMLFSRVPYLILKKLIKTYVYFSGRKKQK